MPLIISDSSNLPPFFNEIPPTFLAVTHASASIIYVSDEKNTQSYVQKTANDVRESVKNVTKRRPSRHALPSSDLLQTNIYVKYT